MSNIEMQRAKGTGQRARGKKFFACLFPVTHYASPLRQSQKGFTLIEVLVALAIVSGVFLVALTSFSYHIDIFDRKKDSLKLVLQAKENLYLYKSGQLIELKGAKDGIEYEIKTEDMEYNLMKVTSRTMSGKDEASLLEYVRK